MRKKEFYVNFERERAIAKRTFLRYGTRIAPTATERRSVSFPLHSKR